MVLYCLYHWNVCLLIWFILLGLILYLSLKCLSVNMVHPMSSHIVFIIEMFVCWYDSPYELSYCLIAECLSVDMIHPMSSHIVFIIEMFACLYEWPYEPSYCLYHWSIFHINHIWKVSLQCVFSRVLSIEIWMEISLDRHGKQRVGSSWQP